MATVMARQPLCENASVRIKRLERQNAELRRTLAETIAQLCWMEGGSFDEIERRIRPHGFKLEDVARSNTPKIVPL